MKRRRILAWVLVAGVLTGCGQGEPSASGPTVVDADLGGSYVLDRLLVDGAEIAPAGVVQFEIDAEFGDLRISTECAELLGSYSLLPDGRAGVTIAGGSEQPCAPADAEQQSQLIEALSRVVSWSSTETALDLESPDEDLLSLTR